ncbi:hypothetical protein ADUPG1_008338 [Aduncisulcus paluster]|uniref:Uncharacterized protein n=1 Tax=Aduncisulcus paluster TaxID=2918883 RepID=A0ABQ5KU26_9EUKA|nr:hypothetical protein ADUPG1_008338 [Aduncisulcus paluster]
MNTTVLCFHAIPAHFEEAIINYGCMRNLDSVPWERSMNRQQGIMRYKRYHKTAAQLAIDALQLKSPIPPTKLRPKKDEFYWCQDMAGQYSLFQYKLENNYVRCSYESFVEPLSGYSF